jgi:hypothetical protein
MVTAVLFATVSHFFDRWRLAVLGVCLFIALLGLFAFTVWNVDSADAMSRTIHPCLLGDEPCNTPAPTPKPR